MAKDIFSKINLKDYNNTLETILENKDFSEDVKNLLLSMLYKIENAYQDYINVKVNVCTKREFVKKIIKIIEEQCNDIEFIRPIAENEKYFIDRKIGKIKTFQNENVLLQAIVELSQKDIEFNEKYELIKEPLKDMLVTGSRMNQVEIIRDFNGWSWDIPIKDIENINYNTIFQLFVILFGNQFTDEVLDDVKENEDDENIPNNVILRSKYNESFGLTVDETRVEEKIDYIEIMQDILKEEFGNELAKEFWESLTRNIIVIYASKDEEYKKYVIEKLEEEKQKLEKMQNNKIFLESISLKKKEINQQIKNIDSLLNNNTELKEEYNRRNEKLANKDKIFSVSHLVLMLEKQRTEFLEEIKRLNKMIEPMEFVKIKKQVEDIVEFYESLNITEETNKNQKEKLEELKLTFLHCFTKRIQKASKKEDIDKLIYELRYFELLPDKIVVEQNEINQVEKMLVKKACEMKILTRFSEDDILNTNILRNIFVSRIITMQNIVISLKYEDSVLWIEMYDGNIHDKTVELKITEKTELIVKLKKKIKVWN